MVKAKDIASLLYTTITQRITRRLKLFKMCSESNIIDKIIEFLL